mmetsp:Transcript_28113/g.61990  ORF Transcript_28113/g.61990 Transcript_28113/m.61990 type:complete len:233 (-) Transcript_28113:568-1266(-)
MHVQRHSSKLRPRPGQELPSLLCSAHFENNLNQVIPEWIHHQIDGMWSHLNMDCGDHLRRGVILQELLQRAASRLLLRPLHHLAFEVVPNRGRDARVGTRHPPLAQASLGPLRSKTIVKHRRVSPCAHGLHLGQIRHTKPEIGHRTLGGQSHHQCRLSEHGLLGQQIETHSESERRIESRRRRHVREQIQILWCRQWSWRKRRHGSEALGQRRGWRRNSRKAGVSGNLCQAG